MKKSLVEPGYTEDEILPIYVGIISNTMKQGSLLSNQVLMESKRMFFFSWLNWNEGL